MKNIKFHDYIDEQEKKNHGFKKRVEKEYKKIKRKIDAKNR